MPSDHCHLQSYQSGIQIFLDFSLIWNKHISAMILSIFSKKHVHDKSCIFYGWFHYCMTEYIVITTIIMINDAVSRSTIQMLQYTPSLGMLTVRWQPIIWTQSMYFFFFYIFDMYFYLLFGLWAVMLDNLNIISKWCYD